MSVPLHLITRLKKLSQIVKTRGFMYELMPFANCNYNFKRTMIHLADPQSLVILFSHMLSVRPYVSTFQNLANQNKFQAKTIFTTGETVSMAEWITYDSCLVLL